jgi:hypothetical protein
MEIVDHIEDVAAQTAGIDIELIVACAAGQEVGVG